MTSSRGRLTALVLLACLGATLLAPDSGAAGLPGADVQAGTDVVVVRTLSNRADLLSGGNALVEVLLPSGTDPAGVTVTAAGRDATAAFAVRDDGRLMGLLDDLPLGPVDVTATLPDGSGATLTLTMHPSGGPIFAGTQVTPWICATEEHGLGPPLDDQCSVAGPVHELLYRPTTGSGFQPYDPDDPPDDVATTTTDEGVTVPYVIRRERGVIDRGIYDIAVLYDPSAEGWDRWSPQPGWNGKLHWTFGGSCQPYHAQQPPDGRPDGGSPGVLDDRALSRGFAVASSGMSTLGNNCNTVVSAEALMMIKEHLVETYGDVRYTFGIGGSGGSIQQVQIADAYPGLLDGIIPQSTFADIVTTAAENLDCRLAVHYFTGAGAPLGWTPAQQAAVQAGVGGTAATCHAWTSAYGFPAMLAAPTLGCLTPLLTYIETDLTGILRSESEPDWVYDPEDNPDGVRCTIYDYMQPIFGTDPVTGFAARPYDNVGVQYGLQALQAGLITPEQFVHLNEHIGSVDLDYRFQPDRVAAGEEVLRRAHASGQVTSGRWLRDIPILDSSYPAPHGDIHTAFHAFSLHERILAAGGTGETHVIRQVNDGRALFDVMDEWLATLEADTAAGTAEERVVRTRPADAVPTGSYLGTDPRMAAGAPLRDDVVACQLQPLDVADHGPLAAAFTDDQLARLAAVFPDGVCDYDLPGVGQTETIPWATYTAGDGPEPLGPPPESVPFGPGTVAVHRVAGSDRITTAVAVSGLGVAQADTVVLARADDHADALTGAPLAASLQAPLLLTHRDTLPTATSAEIRRLGATRVVLLGGEAAIGPAVADDLAELGLEVRRVAGADRYATAVAVMEEMEASDGVPAEVLVASGATFADALSAAALGATAGVPVLLTDPDQLPAVTAAALRPGTAVRIVGGEAAVSPAVGDQLAGATGTPVEEIRRLAGPTRYGTAAAAATAALAAGASAEVVWVATGEDFPDALVAAAAAARDGGVLLLVDGSSADLPAPTDRWLAEHADRIATIRVAGGRAAVGDATVEGLRAALGDGAPRGARPVR